MLKNLRRVLLMLALCGVSTLAQMASTAELRGRIEQIARAAQGRVGATATVLETGESVALQGDKRFPMQSVYKLPIGMAVLNQVDRGALKREQTDRVLRSDFVAS